MNRRRTRSRQARRSRSPVLRYRRREPLGRDAAGRRRRETRAAPATLTSTTKPAAETAADGPSPRSATSARPTSHDHSGSTRFTTGPGRRILSSSRAARISTPVAPTGSAGRSSATHVSTANRPITSRVRPRPQRIPRADRRAAGGESRHQRGPGEVGREGDAVEEGGDHHDGQQQPTTHFERSAHGHRTTTQQQRGGNERRRRDDDLGHPPQRGCDVGESERHQAERAGEEQQHAQVREPVHRQVRADAFASARPPPRQRGRCPCRCDGRLGRPRGCRR